MARNNSGPSGVSRPMQTPTHLDRPLGQVARTALRSVLLVGMAMLLILVLLPAAIAAQAAAI